MKRFLEMLMVLMALMFIACGGTDIVGENDNENNSNANENANGNANSNNTAECGNGILEVNEDCDDGSQNSDTRPNACRTDCQDAYCGDGVIDNGEECDGVNLAANSCQSRGYTKGQLDCTNSCTFDLSDCSFCGNDVAEGTDATSLGYETCDGSDLRGETCTSLGHPTGPLACNPTCGWDTSDCTGSPPVCGNGTLEATELCDDGNVTPCDGCSPTCLLEACGNGVIECSEQCDDGNTNAGDGCSPTCVLEGPPICGNGVVQAGELCDDGNLVACDGCSPTCLIEVCGNGVQDCGETCDDGNTNPGDGCGPTCLVEMCGNNYLDPGENCEPGLDPYCHGDCVSFCGDGVEQSSYGEYCDDGNNVDGDNCYSDCTGNCGDGLVHDGVTFDAGYGGVPPDHGEDCDPFSGWTPFDTATCDEDCTFVTCGDGHCNSAVEDITNCPSDCVPATCGNGVCDAGEDNANCPQDCLYVCGNGYCEIGWGEDTSNCWSDCPPGSVCGDGVCDFNEWGATFCFVDCYAPCGDGTCDFPENHGLCPQDCP